MSFIPRFLIHTILWRIGLSLSIGNSAVTFFGPLDASSLISTHHDNTCNGPYYQIQLPQVYAPSLSPTHQRPYPSPLHNIYVQPSFLTPEQTQHCLTLVDHYAATTQVFANGRNTDRHVNYATVDFPIQDCTQLYDYLINTLAIQDKLWNLFNLRYNISAQNLELEDLFVVQYQAKNNTTDTKAMDRLEAHRDGTLLSFTIVLSPPSTFQGGGTFFEALRHVQPCTHLFSFFQPGGTVRVDHAGDLVMHCGKILHGAETVSYGKRIVLVGFVHVLDTILQKGVISKACRDWGRMDVALIHGNNPSNTKKHPPPFQSSIFKSAILSKRITQSTLKARAKPDYQRFKRLETEDILLRDALVLNTHGQRKKNTHKSSFSNKARGKGIDDSFTIL